MGMSQSYGPSPGDRQEIIARGILAGRRGPGRRPAVCRHPGREGVTVRDSQPSARRLSGKCTERNRCPARGPRPGRPWAEGPVVLRPSAGVDLGAAAGGDPGEGAGVCAGREGEEGPDPRRAGGVDRPASDWARAALRDAVRPKLVMARKPRASRYGPRQCRTGDLLGGARAPAGKQLPVLAPMLCRDGELKLSEEEATLLVGMSAATIDRRLAPERANMTLHGA